MKALIFGISGQDGFYLKELCTRNGIEVIGVSRSEGNWIRGDVSDFILVVDLIKEERPDFVFHLAANSTTSHVALFDNHETIAKGSLNILESCYRHAPAAKIFLSGSALQFENRGLPIKETDPFVATSPYVIARNYSVFAARYYRGLGLRVYIGYFFHHDSPLRSSQHFSAQIIQGVKSILAGKQEKIKIGNPDVVKEFNFAGDMMEAVWLLVNQNNTLESVIGSGVGYKLADWVEMCFKLVGLNWIDFIEIQSGFKSDFPVLVSNPSTLLELGWKPKVNMMELATMMMQNEQ